MSDLNSSNREVIEEFRRNGGRVGGLYEGASLLLLTTTGRRSGKRHTTPLAYQTDDDRLIVIAANVGATRWPDWYHNLVAHPRVTVEMGNEAVSAVATIVEGEARERFLARARASLAEAMEVWPELADMPAEMER
ncbi:MAG: nitroreductase family deazaflavin-dependent oxidoreductase [Chloroflexi bacterium]|nr:nitroreductase family deazaflavin-dependent oxidoreductase [Chloroflexota bacterium]